METPPVLISDGSGLDTASLAEWQSDLLALFTEFNGSEHRTLPETLVPFPRTMPVVRFLLRDPARGNLPRAMASLTLRSDGTGLKTIGCVEDVFVSPAEQGRGYGKLMMTTLIAEARRRGLDRLELTSRPFRENANRLYRTLGFTLVAPANPDLPDDGTNFYRLYL